MYNDICDFLTKNGLTEYEGSCQQIPKQVKDLIELTKTPNINVMEIGFNAGHSAEVFLKNNPTLKLTSFDIARSNVVYFSKKYIDDKYPDRHNLIIGDSNITVPNYFNCNNDIKFDIIFIDGGHEYEVCKNDLNNCFNLAHKDTIVMLDDTCFTKDWGFSWTFGPTKVWEEFVNKNKIFEINRIDYERARGMSWGKYNFDAFK